MDIAEQISADIKKAMLAKDKPALEALRGVKKVILEAKTSKGSNGQVSDEDVIKIIRKLAKQGKDSAAIYKEQNREDLSEHEMAQVKVLETYLPKQMSDEELSEAIKAIISKTGAETMKDMGKVMGIATKELAGKAEGRKISGKVKELLS